MRRSYSSGTTFLVVATILRSSLAREHSIKDDKSLEKIHMIDKSIEKPDIFSGSNHEGKHTCDENPILEAWCDSKSLTGLECGMLPDFDEYGCNCYGSPSHCPTECVGGDEMTLRKTHFGIRCSGIPVLNEPNYILTKHRLTATNGQQKKFQKQQLSWQCEMNSIVSAWCNDSINPHLECSLNTEDDQYYCHCSGRNANCPLECIDGAEPISRSPTGILCSTIPSNNPNYILKEPKQELQ